MTKTFTLDGVEYTVTPCTAIASCDLEAAELLVHDGADLTNSPFRQEALLVENTADSGEKFQKVCFGYDMPVATEDLADMCEDTSAWESDHETLATVQERKVYYMADDDYIPAIYIDDPTCIDLAEVERLAREWDMTTEELLEQMHEATAAEIAEFGVYDS